MTERRRVDLLLTNARIALPGGSTLDGWLAVSGEQVAGIGESSPPPAEREVDCAGRLVLPGLVDLHVHFRDPDHVDKEDFVTGSAAAACGGVTTVVDMPNDDFALFSPEDVRRKLALLEGRSFVDYGLYAQLDDSAEHIPELRELGVAGLKWYQGYEAFDTRGPIDRAALMRALRAAAEADMLVAVHAEASPWVRDLGEAAAEGRDDALAHPASRPPFVEALGVAEAAIAAAEAGCRLHFVHLSSEAGLRAVTAMRAHLPLSATVETCPQYLFLTSADVKRLGTMTRVNPPIRSARDVEVLWDGIAGRDIDSVGTDHAPHLLAEKRTASIWDARAGLLGVETLFPMLFHEVCCERLALGRFTELTAERPAEIAGIPSKGRLLPGCDADIVIVDPELTMEIRADALHSKNALTPYEGWVRRGLITGVYLRGRCVVLDGMLADERRGRYVPSRPARAEG